MPQRAVVCDTHIGEAGRDRVGRRLCDGWPLIYWFRDEAVEPVAGQWRVYAKDPCQLFNKRLCDGHGLGRWTDDADLIDAGILVGVPAEITAGGASW